VDDPALPPIGTTAAGWLRHRTPLFMITHYFSLIAFRLFNLCGLTFLSILSKKMGQVFVRKLEISFLGERSAQRGQASLA